VLGDWRRLHNEELHKLYVPPNIIRVIKLRRMGWAGSVRNAYKILFGKPEGKRPRVRPRCRWEGNIINDLREIGCECAVYIHLARFRDQCRAFVNAVMNLPIL
jgi:hypothetical protein